MPLLSHYDALIFSPPEGPFTAVAAGLGLGVIGSENAVLEALVAILIPDGARICFLEMYVSYLWLSCIHSSRDSLFMRCWRVEPIKLLLEICESGNGFDPPVHTENV